MNPGLVYIVCDGDHNMAWLETKMWGKPRYVAAIFRDEQDALDVAMQVEQLSGVPHTVAPVEGPLSGIDASFAARRSA